MLAISVAGYWRPFIGLGQHVDLPCFPTTRLHALAALDLALADR